jgi:hypothetical protein
MILFLIFFPREDEDVEYRDTNLPTWKEALLVLYVSSAFLFVVFVISVYLEIGAPERLPTWADFLGSVGTVLSIIQYVPQIWTTWKLQDVGSLSIPMMLIQTPGSFVLVGSLYARLGAAGWSTWGLFLVTGCLQGTILSMAISFAIRDWRQARAKSDSQLANESNTTNASTHTDGTAHERTPLLPTTDRT